VSIFILEIIDQNTTYWIPEKNLTGGWDLIVKLKFCQFNLNLVDDIENMEIEYYIKKNSLKNRVFRNNIFHVYNSSGRIDKNDENNTLEMEFLSEIQSIDWCSVDFNIPNSNIDFFWKNIKFECEQNSTCFYTQNGGVI
jgi:hypothetical protein